MPTFMVIHRSPRTSWEEVEKKWMELAEEHDAAWVRTWFNKQEGIRFCEWLAPNARTLEGIFGRHGVAWESIHEVEKTSPGAWRWTVGPTAADDLADTES
jgi:hypothetical protein